MSNSPIYPNITVDMTNQDHEKSAVILSRAVRAMTDNGVPVEERRKFLTEARGKGRDMLIDTVKRWVSTTR